MIELRDFLPSDVPDLVSWIDGPGSLILWSGPSAFRWPLDDAQLLSSLDTERRRRRSWTAVETNAPDTPLGHISLAREPHASTGRLGRVLVSPQARGRGLGELLVTSVQQLAFNELHLHRLSLGVFAHNERALHLYERLGFVREGTLREVCWVEGVWWSTVEMGLLDHEWRAARRH
ncbi:GNAT family N-acetyltransferase [Thermomonospora umbrina]|uniref:RimJ/RimL family protein N-acetyltransferase n=1 Tax=Thermomonospora umbrina TaxID=111806 RepID=A0A3D9SL02_9ACTN|nr:GNAT family protein [Thermomonospora umbrina]REE96387.1 RimJ/RimL family protein N-acetyltransferase [Thermomonospora umbrina]